MRILVVGGSFNPVHIGHLAMAEELMAEFGYDRALFVPSCKPPHKELLDDPGPEARLEMIRLAIGEDGTMSADACEIERGGVSYTIETLAELGRRHPIEGKPGLVLGDDLVPGFPTWKRAEEIARLADLVCAHRSSAEELELAFPHRYAHNSIVQVSSRLIRERIASGGPFRRLLPPAVYEYILEKRLYGLA